jgi:hypothetical protein
MKSVFDPEMFGHDYTVIGAVKHSDRIKIQGNLSIQKGIEYLHGFKEIITFECV